MYKTPRFLSQCDGYKLDHRRQFPKGTERIFSNFTPRSSRIAGITEVPFLGLEVPLDYINHLAHETFFSRPVKEVCDEYQARLDGYFGPDHGIGTSHIQSLHKLGYLPLEFRAWPGGSLVPLKMPFFTMENTLSEFFWVGQYLETILSSMVWQPITNAALARRFKKTFIEYAKKTGSDLNFAEYQGHDFSFRGMAGPEAAARSGIGHLLYFYGTDTLPAIDLAEDVYGPECGIRANSVPASEHAVMCVDGRENELETIARILGIYKKGIVSIVSDTWNLWRVIDEYLPRLKPIIMGRDGKTVIRPDSGDPVKILTGDSAGMCASARNGVIHSLYNGFGGTTLIGEKGRSFRLLDSHIGAIYGDSINLERQRAILERLYIQGYASQNAVLGIGSYSYQYNTRDEYGMAMKATWARVNGEERKIQKDPITDTGTKKSAVGRIAILQVGGETRMIDNLSYDEWCALDKVNILRPVWRDGNYVTRNRWDKMRTRANV